MESKPQGHGMLGPNVLLAQQKSQQLGVSNSDVSCSNDAEQGSQIYNQRPAKKPRLEIEGSQKNVYDIDEKLDDSHQDVSKVRFVSVNSLPPAEAIFTIEKIRNKIFSRIRYKDLTNCRLVCRTWNQYATDDTNTMLNWEPNRICIGINKLCGTQNFTVWNRLKSKPIPLQQLTELMDLTGAKTFPCNSLTISGTQFTDVGAVLNEFLDKHGFRFKKLRLNLDYVEPTRSMPFGINKCVTWSDCDGVIKIKFFARLLQKQLINLERLSFNVTCPENYSNARVIPLVNSTDPTENEIIPGIFNLNLQSVTFTGNISPPLLECIYNLAPNLKEINTKTLSWYLSPKNRLTLCTFLVFSTVQSSFREGDPLEVIANMHGNLQVRTMQVGPILSSWSHPYVLPGVADVFVKILNKCTDSLETLIIVDRMTFLSGFKMPTLPNVKFIDFRYNMYSRSGVPYFPKGIQVSESFPNLRTVQTSFSDADEWRNVKNFLTGDDEEVISSVKLVKTACKQNLFISLLYRLFPNAVVENTGVTSMVE